MQQNVFLLCVLAVTAYLAVTAWEDHKTCEVTRWKHLIGLVPASCISVFRLDYHSFMECAIILAFSVAYILIGYLGVYGKADGFVFAILSLFFGGIGGLAGIGIVILIMVLSAISFMVKHIVVCISRKEKLFRNVAGAYIPHIFVGYLGVAVMLMLKIVY